MHYSGLSPALCLHPVPASKISVCTGCKDVLKAQAVLPALAVKDLIS